MTHFKLFITVIESGEVCKINRCGSGSAQVSDVAVFTRFDKTILNLAKWLEASPRLTPVACLLS